MALGLGEVRNEDCLAMARSKGDLIEYSIGDELHANPADPLRPRHKHMYLKLTMTVLQACIVL